MVCSEYDEPAAPGFLKAESVSKVYLIVHVDLY